MNTVTGSPTLLERIPTELLNQLLLISFFVSKTRAHTLKKCPSHTQGADHAQTCVIESLEYCPICYFQGLYLSMKPLREAGYPGLFDSYLLQHYHFLIFSAMRRLPPGCMWAV